MGTDKGVAFRRKVWVFSWVLAEPISFLCLKIKIDLECECVWAVSGIECENLVHERSKHATRDHSVRGAGGAGDGGDS